MLCKIWGFHGSDYEECLLECYAASNARTDVSEEHIASIIRVTRIGELGTRFVGFHGGEYEECRLLGYKTPAFTSQETHYFFTTKPSQLMPCKIWSFHGSDYEECRLLGCYAVSNVRTDVSEEHIASIIRVTRIGERGTTLAVTINRSMLRRNTVWERKPVLVTLMMEAICSSQTLVLTRGTRRNIQKRAFFIVTAVKTSNIT
jgi:hypothetical protein